MERKNAFAQVFFDLLCAGLLSLGAAMALLPALGQEAHWFPLLLAVALSLALFLLLKRWPLQTAGALGLAGALFFLYQIFVGSGTLGEWASSQIAVLWNGTLPAEAALPFPAVLLLALPVTLVFWLLLRCLPKLWIVTLLSAGLVAVSVFFAGDGWLPPFLLLFAGNLLFLPRINHEGAGRPRAQLVAAILALPVLGLGLLLGPKENGEWQSQSLIYLVQDAGDFWEFHFGQLPELSITSMRSMGLQPQRGQLGGDIELSDETVITSGVNTLLRGQVLDVYTGNSWEDSDPQENGNFRYESVFWGGRKTEAFGLDLPQPGNRPLLKELLTETDADLTMRFLSRSLFLPYRTEAIEPVGIGNDLYFTMQGEVYWNAAPSSGYRAVIRGETWNLDDPKFDRNLRYLEEFYRDDPVTNDDPYFEDVKAEQLQLPDSLPDSVRQLAKELTADALTPYQAVTLLRDYLSEHCVYTLTPGDPDPEQDFVAEFLEQKQGYCTYYASALTVLCRAAGVPARYVTGYAMVPDGERFKATRATAHAWTEVYLEHIGWVPADALRSLFVEEPETAAPPALSAQQPVPTPTPAPTPAAGALQEEREPKKAFDPKVFLWGLPVLGAIGLFFLLRVLQRRRYTEAYVKRRFPGRTDAAGHYYAGLLRLLKVLGQEPQPGETLSAFGERVCARLPEELAAQLQKSFEIISRMLYGSFPPSEPEFQELNACYQTLRRYLHEVLGRKGRLLVP